MNYIKEINAFYDRQEQVPLSGAAVALWYALMHINNKTRWKNTFTSPGSVLRNKAGLTESSFKRARKELASLGYIEVESQGHGKAPVYKIHSLVVEIEQDEATMATREAVDDGKGKLQSDRELNDLANQVLSVQLAEQTDEQLTQVPTQPAEPVPNQGLAPLIKQYNTKTKTNTKQNKRNTAAADAGAAQVMDKSTDQEKGTWDALQFYQENFGVVSPFVTESLLDWIDSLGEDLVIAAMKRALERNKTSWAYVKSILNAWHKKGIRTLDQAKAEHAAFEKERGRKGRGNGGFFTAKEDIVPDWYHEEKQKMWKREQEREEKARKNGKVAEVELERLMKEYWDGVGGE